MEIQIRSNVELEFHIDGKPFRMSFPPGLDKESNLNAAQVFKDALEEYFNNLEAKQEESAESKDEVEELEKEKDEEETGLPEPA